MIGLEASDEGEARLAAAAAPGGRARDCLGGSRLLPVAHARREEQLEPPESAALGGMEEPEGADAVHAPRRDVLQEATQHLLGGQGEYLVLMIACVAVPEGHGVAVHREQRALGHRGAMDVAAPGAFDGLVAFIKERKGKPFVEDFSAFEREFWERVRTLGQEVFAEELAKADIDAEAIVVEGVVHRRVLRGTETYMTTAGPVEVERTLYKDRTDPAARAISAFESRAGVMAGFWMPLAAQQATWLVAQMTPKLAEEALRRVGMMRPSKSTMDRLPKELSGRWEEDRERFEAELRATMSIPEGTHTIAVSIDGVLAPMKDGDAVGVRERTAARGKQSKGPAGYREVGCATLTFCDAQGQQISAIRMARMPEYKKASLKRSLLAELLQVLTLGRNLRVVKIADAAGDNWDYLHGADMPPGTEVTDFFHAAEHLHGALAAAYGDGTPKTRERFATLRHLLLDEVGGVEKVIRALHYLRGEHPRTTRIADELAYFRRHRKRMNYAELKAANLPIGSGVVEAACKTLVAQRMKQSGMRWGVDGGQAILTARGWCQSDRFDKAWALIAATYKLQVTTLDNVVPLRRPS